MANIAIFRINYKSDFILTLNSDAGWMTPFCIKFWTGAPSQAYFVGYDGTTYTHCAPVAGDPTKLLVQFDDHHLPIGDLKFQIAYHFTVADFPTSVEDEVINQAAVIIDQDGTPMQVMLDLNGETAPEIQFSLPAYANEAQRIANEQQRIANEQERIEKEQQRIANEETRQAHEAQRIAQETARVNEFATLKAQSQAATSAANTAAALANEKAQLAADKAALAGAAATLANAKAQLAADKAALADAAATLANDKAALAQQKAEYAQQQGGYAKDQGDYAKNQGDYAKEQGDTALADHQRAESDHGTAVDDHTQAGNDHTRAESDHGTAVDDHTQAGNDHTRAESDHGIAVDDHTQAGNDHTRAESDHGIAVDDHTQAGNDHTRAESDHTRAESDHAAVEVYVDSLGAFDISAYHATGGVLAKYADLTAALGTNGANIPDALRKGGMSVKFVHTSDNKYVQWRYMGTSIADADFTNVANWQGVDEEPVADSKNLITSGSVHELQEQVEDNTEEIENKANKDGYYESLGAGTATNLKGNQVKNDMFVYRHTAGSTDVASGGAVLEGIKGNTIKFNQLLKNGDFSNGISMWYLPPNSYTSYTINDGLINIVGNTTIYNKGIYCSLHNNFNHFELGHVYYVSLFASSSKANTVRIMSSASSTQRTHKTFSVNNELKRVSGVFTIDIDIPNMTFMIKFTDNTAAEDDITYQIANVNLIDLTKIFGSGNEPSTVEAFESWLAANVGLRDYYAYNTGGLIPVKMTGLKTNGFNQYNNDNPTAIKAFIGEDYQITGTYTKLWESDAATVSFSAYTYGGTVTVGTAYSNGGNHYMSNKPVAAYGNTATYSLGAYCIQNDTIYKSNVAIDAAEEFDSTKWDAISDIAAMVTEGILTSMDITPDSNGKFVPTKNYLHVDGGDGTTCVHFVWSGAKDGESEAYWEQTKNVPITSLTGKLNGQGNSVVVFPDGMKKAGSIYDEIKDNKAIKRIGSVDLGSLTWIKTDTSGGGYLFRASVVSRSPKELSTIAVCSKYSMAVQVARDEKTISGGVNTVFVDVIDTSYSDAATFKTAMNGVMLYYELATPEVYILDDFELPMGYKVDDYGTEEVLTPTPVSDELTSCAPTLGIRYGLNAADTIRNLHKNYISKESFDNFLDTLNGQLAPLIGGTIVVDSQQTSDAYTYSFVPASENPEPEPEP